MSCSTSDLAIREPVAKEYQKRKDEAKREGFKPDKLSIEQCKELIQFLSILEHDPATIVIDALDECDPSRRHELLNAIDGIIQESASLVKVFLSSRDDNDIVCHLENSPDVVIQARDNAEDIKLFVQTEVNRAVKDRRLLRGSISEALKNQIMTTLIQGAQGM